MAKAAQKLPLSMRFPAADLAVIDRAARLRGRSRTDFVREAAVRAAEEALLDQRLITLSPGDFQAFREEIERPGRPVPEIVELLRRKPPWSEPGDR
jgi:uncharacterized protein (DUF1778 family)